MRNSRSIYKHIRATHSQTVDNIKLTGEKLEAILLKSGPRQGSQTLPITLTALSRGIREQKEVKWIQTGKEDITISLFADDMIVYLSNSKNFTREVLYLKNNFSKVA